MSPPKRPNGPWPRARCLTDGQADGKPPRCGHPLCRSGLFGLSLCAWWQDTLDGARLQGCYYRPGPYRVLVVPASAGQYRHAHRRVAGGRYRRQRKFLAERRPGQTTGPGGRADVIDPKWRPALPVPPTRGQGLEEYCRQAGGKGRHPGERGLYRRSAIRGGRQALRLGHRIRA